jgi:hypothetical protein
MSDRTDMRSICWAAQRAPGASSRHSQALLLVGLGCLASATGVGSAALDAARGSGGGGGAAAALGAAAAVLTLGVGPS